MEVGKSATARWLVGPLRCRVHTACPSVIGAVPRPLRFLKPDADIGTLSVAGVLPFALNCVNTCGLPLIFPVGLVSARTVWATPTQFLLDAAVLDAAVLDAVVVDVVVLEVVVLDAAAWLPGRGPDVANFTYTQGPPQGY